MEKQTRIYGYWPNWSIIVMFIWLLICCNKESDTSNQQIEPGKNKFTLTVDGHQRQYFVHVPFNYDGKSPFPVVFMLHGTTGNGEIFYNISGWKELAETDSILTVFPSSGPVCIIDADNKIKNTTKWNSLPSEWRYCPQEEPRDDLKFLKSILEELNKKLNIDQRRVYLVGFSNGGQMAAKCAIFLSDIFAAIIEDAGSFYTDTVYRPIRRLPTAFMLGNLDYGPEMEGPEIALSKLPNLLNTSSPQINNLINTHIKSFNLENTFKITGDTNTVLTATFKSKDGQPQILFSFVYVKGLGHIYPNGVNHWLYGAKVHWNWLKQFKLTE